jgi:sarcosine oxidase subunit beta
MSGGLIRSPDLSRDATIVVIGGRVMGASTAYQVTRAGIRDLVLLEANELASGSSGKPLGGVRAQFSDPANIELGARSLRAFRRFGGDFGVDIGYQQVGYLFLVRHPADVSRYQASIEVQNSLGVDSRMISAAEVAELSPYVDASTVAAAAWSPTDGFVQPTAVVNAYAAAAAELGAEVHTHSPVVGIEQAGDGRSPCSPAMGVCTPRRQSSAPVARGLNRSARWPAWSCPSSRCAARSSSPNRWTHGRPLFRSPSTTPPPPTSTATTTGRAF